MRARKHFIISLRVNSSTSFPGGARATKSTSVAFMSSRRMMSPPRSPSRKTVSSFLRPMSEIVLPTFAPPTAMTFVMPFFKSVTTSALPSTTMISSLEATPGPAGNASSPNARISAVLRFSLTSSRNSLLSGISVSTRFLSRFFARSSTCLRFKLRESSMRCTPMRASQGPTRSTISRDAARMLVSTMSRLDGTRIVPVVFPPRTCASTSIRPMRPFFWSSRKSSSSPKSPSVCPKTAPTMSGFSTIPSIWKLARTRYFTAST